MSNLIFLDLEQVMTIIMGEIPQGVYAQDRADDADANLRSYSSSEIRTVAQLYANLYANLEDVWLNKFLTTVQADGIGNWESELFSSPANANLPFATRQQNLITKLRATGGLSYTYIEGLISSILTPQGLGFFLASYGGGPVGAWHLDFTPLDEDTYLAEMDPLLGDLVGQYDLDCTAQIITTGNTVATSFIVGGIQAETVTHIQIGAGLVGIGIPTEAVVVSKGSTNVTLNVAASSTHTNEMIQINNYLAAGLSQAEFQSIQTTAYTYAVYIYGNANAQTLSTLEQTLDTFEAAGATYVIFNNAAPPIDPDILDLGGGVECTRVDSIDCGDGQVGATYDVWDMSSS